MKSIALGVFEMMMPNNGHPTWRKPGRRAAEYGTIDYWANVADVLNDGGFDFLFFADSYGYPTIDGEFPALAATEGIQFPAHDPVPLVAALSARRPELAYVVTSLTMTDHPYALARRFATLDNLTAGRIGWNIVTGSTQSTIADLFGFDHVTKHDTRYDIADEFTDLVLEYLEGGWDLDAYVNDPKHGVLIDPTRIHRIRHRGDHFRSNGYMAARPGPQGTPVLFQAGTSERGSRFAARNAEAVLLQMSTIPDAIATVAKIRGYAQEWGRDPHDVRLINGATIVVAPTHQEAVEKRAALNELYTTEAAAVVFGANTGIDLRGLDPEQRVDGSVSELGQTVVDRFTKDNTEVTVGEVLERFRLRGLRGFQITGDPIEVADQLEAIVTESDMDGFMLEPTFGGPEAYSEFIELVLPELKRRGLRGERHGDTLRERLFAGRGPRLTERHPGSRFRQGTA